MHIDSREKNPRHLSCLRSTIEQFRLIQSHIIVTGVLLGGIHYVAPRINGRDVTIVTRATPRHFLIWMASMRQLTKRQYSRVFILNYPFIGERDKESTTP